MKKIFIISLTLVFSLSLFAQKRITKKPVKTTESHALMQTKVFDGTEIVVPGVKPTPIVQTQKGRLGDPELAKTIYDLQANSYPTNRAYRMPNGTMGMSSIISEEDQHTNRGTAYNYFNGAKWDTIVELRNVESEKTGFPTLVAYRDGEILISHTVENGLNCYRRDVRGEGEWQLVSSLSGTKYMWARAGISVSSDSTEYLHVIASYQWTDENSVIRTQVKYFRSPDGGNSWDIQAFEIPGFDYATYTRLNSDYMTITTMGSTVVILVVRSSENMMYVRSEDNGDTWTHHMIYEHWFSEQGMEYLDVPMAADDTIELFCASAGTGVLDKDGILHVVFNIGCISRYNAGQAWYSYGAGIDGIGYWNETMGEIERDPSFVNNMGNSLPTIDSTFQMIAMDRNPAITVIGGLGGSWYGIFSDDAYDDAGNAVWPILQNWSNDLCLFYRTYGVSTMPVISIDSRGRMLVAYSSFLKEGTADGNNKYFRRIFARQYNPDTQQWQEETTNVTSDFTYGYTEIIFPLVPNGDVEGGFWNIFHSSDALVGLLLDEDHPGQENIYKHSTLQKDPPDFINEVENFAAFEMYPNPAKSNVDIFVENVSNIKIYNTVGQLVKVINNAQGKINVDVSAFANGVYLVNVSNKNGSSSSQKLIVR